MAREELFETFDDNGEPSGLVPRSRVHRQGLWHRAVNVLLFRSDGRLLLQRRHPDKDVWPGAWDVSVAEHLEPGEGYEAGAARGLREELGIEGVELEPLGGVCEQRLEVAEAGVKDYELQQTFRCVFDGPVSPDPREVSGIGALTPAELQAAFAARPETFTPWLRRCAARCGLLAS